MLRQCAPRARRAQDIPVATVVRFEVEFAGQEGDDATLAFLHAMLAHYRGSGPRLCLFILCADSGDDHEMEMEMEDGDIATVEMDLTMLRSVFCRSDLVSLHVRVLQVLLSFLLSFFLSFFLSFCLCVFVCFHVTMSSCHHVIILINQDI